MSKQTTIVLIAIFSILFLVCAKAIITDLPRETELKENLKYNAQTIKTHLYMESMLSPNIDKISNVQQLSNYLNIFGEENLNNKLSKYNEEFFDNSSLIIITIQEGSGSINESVIDVRRVNLDTLNVIINREVPEVMTCDMAMNHVIIELSKSDIGNITNVLINGK